MWRCDVSPPCLFDRGTSGEICILQDVSSDFSIRYNYLVGTVLNKQPGVLRWSKEFYYQMGELGWFDGKRVELINGEIYEMSPIGSRHAVAVTLVTRVLDKIKPGQFFASAQNPLNAGLQSEPVPDVAILLGEPRDYSSELPKSPVLVVEVADSSLRVDKTVKSRIYALAGVPEYWILDLTKNVLIVHRSPTAILEPAKYIEITTVSPPGNVSPLFAPENSVAISDLLP